MNNIKGFLFSKRLLSGLSEVDDVYFWLGMADSINGRQGDYKYGCDQVVKKFMCYNFVPQHFALYLLHLSLFLQLFLPGEKWNK